MTLKYTVFFSLILVHFYNTGSELGLYLSSLILLFLIFVNFAQINSIVNGEYRLKFFKSDIINVLFGVALLRSFLAGVMPFTTFLYVFFVLILTIIMVKIDVQKRDFWKSIIYAGLIIISINLFFYSIGITSEIFKHKRTNEVRILSYLGIFVQRVNFLLFNNFAYYSMFVCLTAIGFWHIIKIGFKSKLVFTILAIISLLLLDARGPFLSLVLILIFRERLYKIRSKTVYALLAAVIIIPFIYSIVSAYFGLGDEENFELASSRDVIWGIFIQNYLPGPSEFLFGYGYLGQYISGISKHYEFLFEEWSNGAQISLHNSYLQYLVDLGVIGIIFLFITLKSTISKIDDLKVPYLKLLLVYLVIGGVSEMSIQINNLISFLFFIAVVNYIDYRHYNEINIKSKI